jgi:hypothetical protein
MKIMESSGTRPEISVFWSPGCSSCLKLKEFVEDQGLPFESVNLLETPDAMDEVRAAGLRGTGQAACALAQPILNRWSFDLPVGVDKLQSEATTQILGSINRCYGSTTTATTLPGSSGGSAPGGGGRSKLAAGR